MRQEQYKSTTLLFPELIGQRSMVAQTTRPKKKKKSEKRLGKFPFCTHAHGDTNDVQSYVSSLNFKQKQ